MFFLIISKYLRIVYRKFLFWLLIISSGLSYYGFLSLFSFSPIQQSEFRYAIVLTLLSFFIIQAIMLGRLINPIDVFILSEQPMVHTMLNSLMFTFLNFLGTSPLFSLTFATYLLLIPYPENILIIAYTSLLGLALLALSFNSKCSLPFSTLASALSLLGKPWSLSLPLFLIAFLIIPTYMVLRKLQIMPSIIVLKKLGFATLYLQPIVQCLILLLLVIPLIKIFFPQKTVYGTVSPYGSGFISTAFPLNLLEVLLINVVIGIGQLVPILTNLAVRYIDSHLWYLRAIKRIPIKMRLLNIMSTMLIGFTVPALILIGINWTDTVKVEWAPLLCSTGVLVGTLGLTKFERKNEVIIPLAIYFLMPLALYLFVAMFTALLSIDILFLQSRFQELLNNIILPTLFMLLMIYLYELPLNIKLLLIKYGISHE